VIFTRGNELKEFFVGFANGSGYRNMLMAVVKWEDVRPTDSLFFLFFQRSIGFQLGYFLME
jgi:hypothetical protein